MFAFSKMGVFFKDRNSDATVECVLKTAAVCVVDSDLAPDLSLDGGPPVDRAGRACRERASSADSP